MPAAAAAVPPGVPVRFPAARLPDCCQVSERGVVRVSPASVMAASHDAASVSHKPVAIRGDRRAQFRRKAAGAPHPAATA